MASVVFILGAGASRGAGAPLMNNFLATAENLYRIGKVEKYSADFKRVFEAVGKLQKVHSKSELDLKNIEVIFNTLEMAKIIGKFPDGDKEYIDKTIASLRILIAVTLEESVRWGRGLIGYNKLAAIVTQFLEHDTIKRNSAILTFNYDFALDFALHHSGLKTNYFLENTDKEGIPLLKLHGSVNWGQCPECKKIMPISYDDYFNYYNGNYLINRENYYKVLEEGGFHDYYDKHKRCKGITLFPEPFIIPPTWNKTDAHSKISNVWQQAAKELSEAEYIFISGYSMPETDVFFRLLYALGTEGPNLLKKISVFDTDTEHKVEKRFKNILGPAAKNAFHYYTSSFEKMPDIVKSIIAE